MDMSPIVRNYQDGHGRTCCVCHELEVGSPGWRLEHDYGYISAVSYRTEKAKARQAEKDRERAAARELSEKVREHDELVGMARRGALAVLGGYQTAACADHPRHADESPGIHMARCDREVVWQLRRALSWESGSLGMRGESPIDHHTRLALRVWERQAKDETSAQVRHRAVAAYMAEQGWQIEGYTVGTGAQQVPGGAVSSGGAEVSGGAIAQPSDIPDTEFDPDPDTLTEYEPTPEEQARIDMEAAQIEYQRVNAERRQAAMRNSEPLDRRFEDDTSDKVFDGPVTPSPVLIAALDGIGEAVREMVEIMRRWDERKSESEWRDQRTVVTATTTLDPDDDATYVFEDGAPPRRIKTDRSDVTHATSEDFEG